MNRILSTAIVLTFLIGLGGAYVSKPLWASSCCGSNKDGGQAVQAKAEAKSEKAEAIKDPVCNMEVSDIKKAPSEEYKGKVYYFCAEHCKKSFKKDPASYISSEAPQPGKGEGHNH